MDFSECKSGFEFATFEHLISDYDVCYYGYLWYVPSPKPDNAMLMRDGYILSEQRCTAMAQDIIRTLFADNPYDKKVWNKYRRQILQYGGSHPDEMKMLTDFLGRPPRVSALAESLRGDYQPKKNV